MTGLVAESSASLQHATIALPDPTERDRSITRLEHHGAGASNRIVESLSSAIPPAARVPASDHAVRLRRGDRPHRVKRGSRPPQIMAGM